MRNIKLTLQFDGTLYHGWQTQQGDRTVQQTVQEVLSRLANQPVKLHGAGRTDAGVHALGQVAHFKTASALDTLELCKGVNSLLPQDIAVTRVEEVPDDFHSRFDACSRTYWYFIWNHHRRSAFYGRYSWQRKQALSLSAMRQAAKCLVGIHDFSSFQGADKVKTNPVREMFSIRVKTVGKHLIIFEIRANSFLKHMVRNIMGTLADVGAGKLTTDGFLEILGKRDRTCAGITAPAQGLFLREVRY